MVVDASIELHLFHNEGPLICRFMAVVTRGRVENKTNMQMLDRLSTLKCQGFSTS